MGIKVNGTSKPLIVSAVISLFLGSGIGALLLMQLFGISILNFNLFALHKILQFDGFLTLLIMGIGYMLIPRFRNVDAPRSGIVYASLSLVLTSIVFSVNELQYANALMLAGVTIFSISMLRYIKIRPKLLGLSDHFLVLAIISLFAVNILRFFNIAPSLAYIHLWLLFPLLMILSVEYKTLPSFIGFITPRKKWDKLSLILASITLATGLAYVITMHEWISILFSIIMFSMIFTFDRAIYATHGFNYREILQRLSGEELARYKFILLHVKLAYSFLYAALILFMLYHIRPSFALYDLSIHLLAIGFIGLTIKLYLPMMLPPITGRMIMFVRFNFVPLVLILSALISRIIGIVMLEYMPKALMQLFGISGWLIVLALFLYVFMIHKAMS